MNNHLPATALAGTKVINHLGEQLGTINDFMVDFGSGRVAYVVLEFAETPDSDSKLFAVPLQAMQFDPTRICFVFDQTREHLKEAPGFDRDDWPDFADPAVCRSLHAFYSVPPYWS
ncbi:PRC-barrel domain-containing protein [Uliginosibacterium sp. H1]|uniref:PRC-barrel domain-containing protein n=1 Tax=Uliginosibacterium sp. H1 TaxID=3114757 RepID=UPI002E18D377|nr:PRC-barrel domain-containing protein [Uliginosibacterium sp. H1]